MAALFLCYWTIAIERLHFTVYMQDFGIKTHVVAGTESGPHLLFFGAIHGNEPCGPLAIERTLRKFENGELSLRKGSVTFVSIANPRAYAARTRLADEDLNRVFRKSENPQSYEATIANFLCGLVDKADMLLDIHSTGADGPTSVFIDFPTAENTALARALGTTYALLGWPTLYETNQHGFNSFDTTRYAAEHGVGGILIECGQHDDSRSIDVAETAILRTLCHFNVIDGGAALPPVTEPTAIRMTVLGKKNEDADHFAKEWKHLERIEKGALVATRADGSEIRADENVVMLLPKHGAKAGQEWFYLGVFE